MGVSARGKQKKMMLRKGKVVRKSVRTKVKNKRLVWEKKAEKEKEKEFERCLWIPSNIS